MTSTAQLGRRVRYFQTKRTRPNSTVFDLREKNRGHRNYMLILHELVVILETLCTKKNGCNFKLRRSFLLILSEHNLGAVFSSLSKVWGQNSIFRFFVIFYAIY